MTSNYIGSTDQPATKDMFGISNYIDGLRSFISICQTPMTIAVQGDWGSGKTSVMNLVMSELDPNRVFCVEFNAWQFSQFDTEESLAESLITTIIDNLKLSESETGQEVISGLRRFSNNAAHYAKAAARFTANAVGDRVIGGTNMGKLNSSYDEQLSGSPILTLATLKTKFQACIKTAVQEKGVDRIMVFIDDLDRLQPLRAVELLEVLKIFLDCDRCVFVLAIDYNVVVSGVKSKYGVDITADKGRSFFDKIIQVPFKMPVAQYNIAGFVGETFKNIARIDCTDYDTENFVALINSSISNNPRSMKRLFNSYLLLLEVMGKDLDDKDVLSKKTLFAILCMQQHFECFYNFVVMRRDDIDADFLNELATAENPRETLEKEGYVFTEAKAGSEDETFIAGRLQSFIKYFNRAISAKNDGNIDEGCMGRIRNLLKTSSITATETPIDPTTKAPGKYHLRLKNNDILPNLTMRGLAFSFIRDYVQSNPSVTIKELQDIFPLSIQKKIDMIIENTQEMSASKSKYYFGKTPLALADGTEILVSNQWHSGNIGNLITRAQELGYDVQAI
ncbi:MAG: KAP family NTPase [Defluviitaleaceae bacterium]|nr:KAP family NTPase [Defluviitaleaceae bacterium]